MRTHLLVIATCLALVSCGQSKKKRDCEKLKDRVVTISLGIAEQLQKYKPAAERVDREAMKRQMYEQLDQSTFMQECMKLDPKEVDCIANAETKQQWVECGFDQLILP